MENVPPQPPDSPYAPPTTSDLEPPPPPYAPSGLPPLPWEERRRLGLWPALFETMKLFIASPVQAYARMREQGDVFEALLYYILVGWIVGVISLPAMWLQPTPDLSALPPAMREWMGFFVDKSLGTRLIGLIVGPPIAAVFLLIAGMLVHLGLMIVGGLERSRAGMAGTLRVMAYSYSTGVAAAIPIVGAYVAAIWGIVLWVFGLRRVHNTTTGKAVLGVVILALGCCLCAVLLGVLGAMALVPFFKR